MTTSVPDDFRSGFVAIVGRPNVGKSTLLNRLLGQKIAITSPKPQTTRNRILGIVHRDDGQLLFLDTPGIHQTRGRLHRYMVEQALGACAEVDLILMVVDATQAPQDEDEQILTQLAKRNIPACLVINKVDLVAKPALLPLIAAWTERFPFVEVHPISARDGGGVTALVGAVRDRLPRGPRYYPEEMVTDLPERFIVGEMVREQALRQLHDEVPFGIAVAIENFSEQPEKNLVVIHAAIHVSRDSHKRIVVGKGGTMIRSIGQAARKAIERFLGCRVYLELFVKVQEGWTESERQLKEFGYH